MTTPQEYLKNKLENCSKSEISDGDEKLIKAKGLEEYIFHKLSTKKFRKWKLDDSSEKQIKEAIKINVSNNQPIKFTFPFGGYKLWRLPSQPEVDWAEFFSIAHYSNYIAQILPFYKPGVEFYFSSDDIIIERMDNISSKDTDAYFNSFQVLLENFRKYFPDNFKMEIIRVADLYKDKKDFEDELKNRLIEVKGTSALWTEEQLLRKNRMSDMNINWDGAKNLTTLSEEARQEIIKLGPILHDAYTSVPTRRAFVRGEDKVVVFTTPIPNAITIGSTKNSVTKCWTGFGVLENEKGEYHDRILSPSQFEDAKDVEHEEATVNLIPLKNFKKVWVYKQRFDFTKTNNTSEK